MTVTRPLAKSDRPGSVRIRTGNSRRLSMICRRRSRVVLGSASSTMYGVRQPFRGVFNGDALLIFPGNKSLEIVRIVAGQSVPSEDLSAIEQDALTEVGNVMLNACIAALSDLLGNEFQLSPPSIDVGDSRTILGTRIQNHLVVFLHIRFELLTSQIEGFVVFVLNTTSLETLRLCLDKMLGRPTTVA